MFPEMSVRRAAIGALGAVLLLACGERAGDPIVALRSSPTEGNGGAGPDSGGAPDGGGSEGGHSPGDAPDTRPGPLGLCSPCSGQGDVCGDSNDVCVLHDNQSFCGRDCDERGGCPDGYACVDLANSYLWQCVPQDSCPASNATAPALADARQELLSRINAQRALHDRAPLAAAPCLDRVAQQSALDFAYTDERWGKFLSECDPIWPNCECGWNAEAEITISRFDLDWTSVVERAMNPDQDSQSARFAEAFLASEFTDVGIGVWLAGDEAWLALSLH